ncbi:Multiple antibiotic resistance protein marA [Delftia tsuruhatensis]|uniref:AraC family transcriptional regulator n=1 Tax=Delftia tsuruhatensis TaxID=180282 RepID=UPI001E6E0C59|nr:AraC family transcriptional regulator [Delftia tsuruhatensis]CAB5712038.1 Multiple antibiotic resistance protein marA [Delftia tsuruhatensis]CAC9682225.1 Multiple antibiotic resistance protein marA [Delftia tsuruhatensis]
MVASNPQRFTWLRCRAEGVEAVAADTARSFGRHTHDQYGIGLIARGAQRSASGRGICEAAAGDLIMVNPGEVHDGMPIGDGGRAWCMLYLEPSVMAGLATDLHDGRDAPAFEFHHPMLRDPLLATRFRTLFRRMTSAASTDAAGDGLGIDEALLRLLTGMLRRPAPAPCVPRAIALARAMIDDDPGAPLTLAALAGEAGLSRYQFLRAFARATGMTPHAYLVQRRLHHVRRLIAAGMPLAEAAADAGFADQSHMTRLFVRSFGMAPGAYAAAAGPRLGTPCARAAISFKTAVTA